MFRRIFYARFPPRRFVSLGFAFGYANGRSLPERYSPLLNTQRESLFLRFRSWKNYARIRGRACIPFAKRGVNKWANLRFTFGRFPLLSCRRKGRTVNCIADVRLEKCALCEMVLFKRFVSHIHIVWCLIEFGHRIGFIIKKINNTTHHMNTCRK